MIAFLHDKPWDFDVFNLYFSFFEKCPWRTDGTDAYSAFFWWFFVFFGVHNCHCCILLLCWFILSYGEVLSLQTATNQELYTIGHFFRGNDLHAPTEIQILNSQHCLHRKMRTVWGSGSFQRCTHGFTHCTTEPCLRKSCSLVGGSVWGTNVSGEFGGWLGGLTYDEGCSQPSCDLPCDPRFP